MRLLVYNFEKKVSKISCLKDITEGYLYLWRQSIQKYERMRNKYVVFVCMLAVRAVVHFRRPATKLRERHAVLPNEFAIRLFTNLPKYFE